MQNFSVRISVAENVKRFVDIISSHPYETDVREGRHVVDGKSLPGVLSLNLSRIIDIEVYSDGCDDMIKELQPFIVG